MLGLDDMISSVDVVSAKKECKVLLFFQDEDSKC